MKLEDYVNRFDTLYVKKKKTNSNKFNFQDIEAELYTTFANCFSESFKKYLSDIKNQLIQLFKYKTNIAIYTKLLKTSQLGNDEKKSLLQKDTVLKKLPDLIYANEFWTNIFWEIINKIYDKIPPGSLNDVNTIDTQHIDDYITNSIEEITTKYKYMTNKNGINLSEYEKVSYFSNKYLTEIYSSIDNSLANLSVYQLLYCLQKSVVILNELEIPIVKKIIDEIVKLKNLFEELSKTNKTPVVSANIDLEQYKNDFKEILKMFLKLFKKKN